MRQSTRTAPGASVRWTLFGAPTSPFVRKVRIVMAEKGLEPLIDRVACDPFAEDNALVEVNPAAQVPALDAGGRRLTGSDLICAFLDAAGDGVRLIPEGDDQWDVRAREAVADSLMEAAVRLRSEGRRPEALRSPDWTERWLRAVQRGFDRLEATLPGSDRLDLGVIAAVVAGTYVGFRHPHIDWRSGRPRLSERVDRLEARPSFSRTQPDKPL